jgi:hypothetical protein
LKYSRFAAAVVTVETRAARRAGKEAPEERQKKKARVSGVNGGGDDESALSARQRRADARLIFLISLSALERKAVEEKTPKRHDASGRRGGARRATRESTRARRARYRRYRFERAVERDSERGGDVPSFELVLELRAAGATLRDEGKNGRDWRKPVSYARCAGD